MVTGVGIIVSFYRIGRQLRVVDAGAVSGDQPSIKLIRRQILYPVPIKKVSPPQMAVYV